MLVAGQDFQCGEKNKVYVCAASNNTSLQVYKQLQTRIRQVAVDMAKVRPDVPPDLVTIEPDGRIGPTTAIGVQTVLAVLNRTVPLNLDLFPVLSIQATSEATIQRIAAQADSILTYINTTLASYPDAFKMPVTIQTVKVPWWPIVKWDGIPREKIAYGIGGLLLLIGGGYVVHKIHQKQAVNDVTDRFVGDAEEAGGE